MSGAVTRFEYSTINAVTGLPNSGIKLKTCLQDLAANWGSISAQLTDKLDALIKAKTFPMAYGPGPAVSGVESCNWSWFFRDDFIHSIFPT